MLACRRKYDHERSIIFMSSVYRREESGRAKKHWLKSTPVSVNYFHRPRPYQVDGHHERQQPKFYDDIGHITTLREARLLAMHRSRNAPKAILYTSNMWCELLIRKLRERGGMNYYRKWRW